MNEALRRAIEELLACPRCGGGLIVVDEGARCTACGASFAVTDGYLDVASEHDEDGGKQGRP